MSKYDTKHAYKEAENIERELRRELEKTIAYCEEQKGECTHWLEKFFAPALKALNEEGSSVHRLAQACSHLQVFGGMGSWSDGHPSDDLYLIYKRANDFYQECWEQGIV